MGEAQGQHWHRTVVHAEVVQQLVAGSNHIYSVIDMSLNGVEEVVKSLEISVITSVDGDLFAGDAAAAVVPGQLHHGAHVDVGDVGVFLQLAGEVGLHTAAGVPIPGLAEGNALVQHHADTHIVGVHRRHGQAHADAFNCLMQQRIRVLGNTVGHREVGLFELYVFCGLNHHVAELVGGIVTVLVDAAAAGLNGDAVAGRILRSDLVLEQGHLRHLDPQAVQQFLGVVVREDTGSLVGLVVGIQVLVQAAQVVGGSVLLHVAGVLVGQDRLAGLIERAGGMLGHPAADLRDFQQLRLAGGVGALRRLLLRQFRVTVGQVDNGIRHHNFGAIEERLLQVAGHRVIQLGQGFLRLLLDAADAHL